MDEQATVEVSEGRMMMQAVVISSLVPDDHHVLAAQSPESHVSCKRLEGRKLAQAMSTAGSGDDGRKKGMGTCASRQTWTSLFWADVRLSSGAVKAFRL